MSRNIRQKTFRYAGAAASGQLLALAFPNPGWGFLAPFALVPFLLALSGLGAARRTALGAVFGISFFASLVWWIRFVHPAAWFGLMVYGGLVFGLVGLLAGPLRTPFQRVVWFPVVLASVEFLRGSGPLGFAWGCLGHASWQFLPLAQWAEYGGVPLLTFLLAVCNGALASIPFIRRDGWTRDAAWVGGPLAMVLLGAVLGTVPYSRWRQADAGDARLGLVQPNFGQFEKWNLNYLETRIFPETLSLAAAAAREDGIDLVVIPETAFPASFDPPDYDWLVRDMADAVDRAGVPFLFGCLRDVRGPHGVGTQNSVVLWHPGSDTAADLQHYEKMHLVPWGEYVPLKSVLPFLERVVSDAGGAELVPGTRVTVFEHGRMRFGVPICFESTVSDLVRKYVRQGANLLVNVTNDAWFERSGAQDQHRLQSVFRAIENRRAVVRCANTGRTCAIGPSGAVLGEFPLYEQGTLVVDVPLVEARTVFTRFGNAFGVLTSVALAAGLIAERTNRPRGRRA